MCTGGRRGVRGQSERTDLGVDVRNMNACTRKGGRWNNTQSPPPDDLPRAYLQISTGHGGVPPWGPSRTRTHTISGSWRSRTPHTPHVLRACAIDRAQGGAGTLIRTTRGGVGHPSSFHLCEGDPFTSHQGRGVCLRGVADGVASYRTALGGGRVPSKGSRGAASAHPLGPP